MAKLTDEEQTLNSQIGATCGKLAAIERQKGNIDALVDFVKGNRDWVKSWVRKSWHCLLPISSG